MAKSYLGYTDRDIKQETDWADVTSTAKTTFDAVQQKQKDSINAIEGDRQEFMKTIGDTPNTSNKDMNHNIAKFSDDMSETSLHLHEALKAGEIKLSDYTHLNQNLKNSVETTFALYNKREEVNTLYKERLDKGESSMIEGETRAMYDEFIDMESSIPIIDPSDGMVYMVKTDENGKLMEGEENRMKVSEMAKASATTYDRFGMGESLDGAAKSLGNWQTAFLSNHKLKTLEDARQNPEYTSAIDTFLDSILTRPTDAASVLMDHTGIYQPEDGSAPMSYETTFKEEEAGGNKIYMEKNPATGVFEPKLTDEQRVLAKKTLKSAIESRVAYKETAKEFTQPAKDTSAETQKKTQLDVDVKRIDRINKMIAGNTSLSEPAAAAYMADYNAQNAGREGVDQMVRINRGEYYIELDFVSKEGVKRKEKVRYRGADGHLLPNKDVYGGFYDRLPANKFSNYNDAYNASVGGFITEESDSYSADTWEGSEAVKEPVLADLSESISTGALGIADAIIRESNNSLMAKVNEFTDGFYKGGSRNAGVNITPELTSSGETTGKVNLNITYKGKPIDLGPEFEFDYDREGENLGSDMLTWLKKAADEVEKKRLLIDKMENKGSL